MKKMQELLKLIKDKSVELTSIDPVISKDKHTQLSDEIKKMFKEYKAMVGVMIEDLTIEKKANSDELNQEVSQLSPDELNKFLDFVGSSEMKKFNDSLADITKEVNEFINNLEKRDK